MIGKNEKKKYIFPHFALIIVPITSQLKLSWSLEKFIFKFWNCHIKKSSTLIIESGFQLVLIGDNLVTSDISWKYFLWTYLALLMTSHLHHEAPVLHLLIIYGFMCFAISLSQLLISTNQIFLSDPVKISSLAKLSSMNIK